LNPPIVVDMKPDLDKLVNVKHELDFEIIRNLGVPRFLVGYEQEVNKATALEVIGAFIDGPVKDDQRWQKRNVEEQWYGPLTRRWATRNQKDPNDLPVRAVHQCRELRYEDWLELMNTVSDAKIAGWINNKKAFEIMQRGRSTEFDPDEVEDDDTHEVPLDIVARRKIERKTETKPVD